MEGVSTGLAVEKLARHNGVGYGRPFEEALRSLVWRGLVVRQPEGYSAK